MNEIQVKEDKFELGNLKEQASFLAKSQLIPQALRNKPADVAIILLMSKELNIPPLQGINSINVIQGKPCLSPQLCTAMIRSRFPNSYIKHDADIQNNVYAVTMARDKDLLDEAYTATWNDEKAKAMNLLGKDNYKKQKMNMYKWRCLGECARAVFPDVMMGLYLPEEMDVDSTDPKQFKTEPSKADKLNKELEIEQPLEIETPLEIEAEVIR